MRSWLGRSGKNPLLFSCYVPREADEAVSALFDVLNANIFRCREFQLVLPYYYYGPVGDLVSRRTRPMLWLETLSIGFLSSPCDYWEPERGLLIDIESQAAPQLRNFAWKSEELHRSEFNLPWAQLFSIDVDTTMSMADCVNILQQCPLLRTSYFRAVCQPSLPFSRPLLSHHHLRSLNIWTDQPLRPFLHALTLPALRDLKISNLVSDDDNPKIWSSREFTAFISRSRCSLRRLDLFQALRYDTDLVECLIDTTDSLVELRIVSKDKLLFTHEILRLMTIGAGDLDELPCLCPELEVIQLYGPFSSPAAVTALVKMIESRPKIISISLTHRETLHPVAWLKHVNLIGEIAPGSAIRGLRRDSDNEICYENLVHT